MDYSYVRGFNYQPGYAYTSYDAWHNFQPDVFLKELSWGKKAFPSMNTVRLWLSWDAFKQEEDRQAHNFETALAICDSLGLKVVPILFNRWHDPNADNGGIYIDQMIDGSNWCSRHTDRFDSYIQKIVGAHRSDSRILVWDTCNEPFSYAANQTFCELIRPYELAWLEKIYHLCKFYNPVQPVSLSHCSIAKADLDAIAHISDIFLFHLYKPENSLEQLTQKLQSAVDLAKSYGKDYVTTETCWGSLSDEKRTEIIRITLEAHKRVGIGFIAHALMYSHVPDLHNPEDGVVGTPGNLCFLMKDGSVRPGHECFNEY